jgi:hypothetical protein
MFEAALDAALEALLIVVEAVMRFSLIARWMREAPGGAREVAHGRATTLDCWPNGSAAR